MPFAWKYTMRRTVSVAAPATANGTAVDELPDRGTANFTVAGFALMIGGGHSHQLVDYVGRLPDPGYGQRDGPQGRRRSCGRVVDLPRRARGEAGDGPHRGRQVLAHVRFE